MAISDDNKGISQVGNPELMLSAMVAIVTVIIISTSAGPAIVKPMLLDGSLISNGRFAFVYDAYETVGDDDGPSVVGIGSSILLAAMNGACMQEDSEVENTRFYNFAMSGGKPYSEMIQIPALIESKPDVVMLEVGPNSLYEWDPDVHQTGIHDYNEFRFQLMSMGMSEQHIGGWYDVLDEIDKQWIDVEQLKRTDAWSEYTRDAIEEYLRREIDDITDALDSDSYSYVPPVNSPNWDSYLSEPNYHKSRYDGKSPDYIRDDLDNRMPSKVTQGVYNPKPNGTQNHRALDYMIHELLNASIEVVLVGIPHHPWVNEYLQPGQLDGMNVTYDKYTQFEGVTPLQMYWEEWPSGAFDNRNHIDDDGREIFCKRVTPVIDALLNGNNVDSIHIDSSVYDIDIDDEGVPESCSGSDETFYVDNGFIRIEAEEFSDCISGIWQASNSNWQIDTENSGYNGIGYVTIMPDEKVKVGDTTDGPHLGYNISFSNVGLHHLWVRMSAPNGGSDSIHVGLNGVPFTYGGVGLSTSPNNEWNWEYVPINVSSTGLHQLDIWMREDGVRVDSLILTVNPQFDPNVSLDDDKYELICNGSDVTFSSDLTFTQDQGLMIIEAEDYSECWFGSMQSEESVWDLKSEVTGFTGLGYMVANPDVKIKTGDSTDGPHLTYNLSLSEIGTHHIWIRMSAPDGGGDSIHVGLNDIPVTYGGVGLSTSPNGEWNWEYVAINITSTGLNQLDIWMREDGVRIDSLVLTIDPEFTPN